MMMKNIVRSLLLLPVLLTGCGKKPQAPVEATPTPVAAVVPTPTPVPPPPSSNPDAQVIVFCYHRMEGKAGGAISIAPEEFERHLKALKDGGIEVISMEDFLAWKKGEKVIPPRSAVITIDDGYLSGYTVAWPMLKKYGYPFTLFIYTQYISSGGKSLTWRQLEEMRDEGVDIGSHTLTHQDLRSKKGKTDYEAWLKDEIAGSKRILEDKLGIRVRTIAFPLGLHNEEVRKAAMDAGYDASFTVYGQKIRMDTPNDQIGRYAYDPKFPDVFDKAIVFDGVVPGGESAGPVVAELAPALTITQPADNETISTKTPTIKANLAAFGEIDPASIVMRISGIGPVSAKFDSASKNIEYQVVEPLTNPTYTVFISAKKGDKKMETRWSFQIAP